MYCLPLGVILFPSYPLGRVDLIFNLNLLLLVKPFESHSPGAGEIFCSAITWTLVNQIRTMARVTVARVENSDNSSAAYFFNCRVFGNTRKQDSYLHSIHRDGDVWYELNRYYVRSSFHFRSLLFSIISTRNFVPSADEPPESLRSDK